MTLQLEFPGIPFSKQSSRSRIVQGKGRAFVHHYQSAKVKQGERNITAMAVTQLPDGFEPFSGPVIVEDITFVFPPRKSEKKSTLSLIESGQMVYKTTKPDLTDNLQKGVFDALEGIVYLNDSQICEVQAVRKIYGKHPGIYMTIKEAAE